MIEGWNHLRKTHRLKLFNNYRSLKHTYYHHCNTRKILREGGEFSFFFFSSNKLSRDIFIYFLKYFIPLPQAYACLWHLCTPKNRNPAKKYQLWKLARAQCYYYFEIIDHHNRRFMLKPCDMQLWIGVLGYML